MPASVLYNSTSEINRSVSGAANLFGINSTNGYTGDLNVYSSDGTNGVFLKGNSNLTVTSGYAGFTRGGVLVGSTDYTSNARLSLLTTGRSEFRTGVGVSGDLEVQGRTRLSGEVYIDGRVKADIYSDADFITTKDVQVRQILVTGKYLRSDPDADATTMWSILPNASPTFHDVHHGGWYFQNGAVFHYPDLWLGDTYGGFPSHTYIVSDLTLSGDTRSTQNMYLTGDLEVLGDVYGDTHLNFKTGGTFHGDLAADRDIYAGNNVYATGDLNAGGTVSVVGNMGVQGIFTGKTRFDSDGIGNTGSLENLGNITIGGSGLMKGKVDFKSGIILNNDVSMKGWVSNGLRIKNGDMVNSGALITKTGYYPTFNITAGTIMVSGTKLMISTGQNLWGEVTITAQ